MKLQIGDLAITDQCRGGVSVRGYRLDFYVYNNESFRSQLIDIIGTCRSLLVSFHLYEGWKDRYPLFISLYGGLHKVLDFLDHSTMHQFIVDVFKPSL